MTFKLKLSPPTSKGTWEHHFLLDNLTEERRHLLADLLDYYQDRVLYLKSTLVLPLSY